jgi:hypothetical protein
VRHFLASAIEWWNIKRSENINPKRTKILYGYKPETTSFYAFIFNNQISLTSLQNQVRKRKVEGLLFQLLQSKIQSPPVAVNGLPITEAS